ncbi:hypothetical protein ACJIZ3_008717 [Penstemon smallii]|uniref:Uncharacterized protein n=1 Tax=Penstemon smallii TaxID=265156 RepID=A0ABD3TBJ4_9LAMI
MGNDKTSKELRNEKSRARYAKMDVKKKEKLLALARDKYRQRSMHIDVLNKKKSFPMEVTDPSAIASSSNSTVSSFASLSRNSVHFASMGCTESVISNNEECFVQENSESLHMPSICLLPDASPPLVLRRSSRLVTGHPSFLQSKPYDHVQRRTIRNEKDRTRYAAMDVVAQKDLLCRNRAHSALITDQPMTSSQGY